jgi:hypothetical protein
LKAAWFQPLKKNVISWVQAFAFKCVNLYRYNMGANDAAAVLAAMLRLQGGDGTGAGSGGAGGECAARAAATLTAMDITAAAAAVACMPPVGPLYKLRIQLTRGLKGAWFLQPLNPEM